MAYSAHNARHPQENTTLSELIAKGYPVFPLVEGKKSPALKSWQTNATLNEVDAQNLFKGKLQSNIGVLANDLVVVDIDLRPQDDVNGFRSLAKILTLIPVSTLLKAMTVRTQGGGLHCYFLRPIGYDTSSLRATFGKGVDLKRKGGYLVGPGSHIDGKSYDCITLTERDWYAIKVDPDQARQVIECAPFNDIIHSDNLPEIPAKFLNAAEKPACSNGSINLDVILADGSTFQPSTNSQHTSKIKLEGTTHLKEDVPRLRSALHAAIEMRAMDPSDRQEWVEMTSMVTHAVACWGWNEQAAKTALFDVFSSQSTKFDLQENENLWSSLKTRSLQGSVGNPKTLRSLFALTKLMQRAPGSVSALAPPLSPSSMPSASTVWPDIAVTHLIRISADDGWSKVISFSNPDGEAVELIIPNVEFTRTGNVWKSSLSNAGYPVPLSSKISDALKASLWEENPEGRMKYVDASGWQRNGSFFIDGVLNDASETLRLQTPPDVNPFSQMGTLTDWQTNVLGPSADHDKLLFAICTALAGPLIRPLETGGCGFHFYGTSSVGKTTAMQLAASVWGYPDQFIQTWRTTDNALEATAQLHNDTFLALDEIAQIEPKPLSDAAYMLSQGQGKGRMKRDASKRKNLTWRVQFLSTGEADLRSVLEANGAKAHSGGQGVRILDIPADSGCGFGILSSNLKGSPSEFIEAVSLSCRRSYGHVGSAFVEKLSLKIKEKTFLEKIQVLQRGYRDSLLDGRTSSQASRAANHFARVSLAGELAIIFGLFPLPRGTAHTSVTTAYQAWLKHRGTSGNLEPEKMLEAVQGFIGTYASSRFSPLNEGLVALPTQSAQRAGFHRKNNDGTESYIILRATMEGEILRGISPSQIKAALLGKGVLEVDANGQIKSVKLPGLGKTRVYIINQDIKA